MSALALPRRIAVVLLGLGALGCSSADTPTGSTPITTPTYQGVFATGTQSGTLSLTAGSPATGSLKPAGSAAVALTGTYSASTSTFTMTGGAYSLSATVTSSSQLSGTLNGTTAATTGVVSGVQAVSGVTTTYWCGSFKGTDSGTLNVAAAGSLLSALALQDGVGIILTGTMSGSTMTMGYKLQNGLGVNGTGTATGTISGATVTGSWSNTLGSSGTWTASTATCG